MKKRGTKSVYFLAFLLIGHLAFWLASGQLIARGVISKELVLVILFLDPIFIVVLSIILTMKAMLEAYSDQKRKEEN